QPRVITWVRLLAPADTRGLGFALQGHREQFREGGVVVPGRSRSCSWSRPTTSAGEADGAGLRGGLASGGGAVWRRGQTSLAGDKQDLPLGPDKRARLALVTEPQGAPAQVAKHLGVVSVPQDLGAHAGGH